MKTKKQRRDSGRSYTKIYHPEEMPYEEQVWDDWNDFRDGLRDAGHDRTKKIPKHLRSKEFVSLINDKIRKEELIRKTQKEKLKK